MAQAAARGRDALGLRHDRTAVASSDATNIESSIRRDGDDYVINGRKWYTTNATHPHCRLIIFMGKSDPGNAGPAQAAVDDPRAEGRPGVRVLRPLPVMGFYGVPDRAAEVLFDNVRVPVRNMLLGEGRGFEIAQGRLGPGRIRPLHAPIGLAERVLERMCRRAEHRVAFGKAVGEQTVTLERIAKSRILIEQSPPADAQVRLDDGQRRQQGRQAEIAMIKVAAPEMACQVIDWAMQAFGGAGTNDD